VSKFTFIHTVKICHYWNRKTVWI